MLMTSSVAFVKTGMHPIMRSRRVGRIAASEFSEFKEMKRCRSDSVKSRLSGFYVKLRQTTVQLAKCVVPTVCRRVLSIAGVTGGVTMELPHIW